MADSTPKPVKPEVPTKPYRVVSNLRHNGKHYNPGAKVELTDEHAAPLLKSKVVSK